jgi:hypothetical protein
MFSRFAQIRGRIVTGNCRAARDTCQKAAGRTDRRMTSRNTFQSLRCLLLTTVVLSQSCYEKEGRV